MKGIINKLRCYFTKHCWFKEQRRYWNIWREVYSTQEVFICRRCKKLVHNYEVEFAIITEEVANEND